MDGRRFTALLMGDMGRYPYPAHDTGIEVTATVYEPNPWDEDNMPDEPFQVRGTLLIRPSPFGGFQCFVIGSPTDKPLEQPTGHDYGVVRLGRGSRQSN